MILLGLVVGAILELVVIVQVAHAIGIVPMLALMVVVSMVGAAICKRQGVAVVQRIRVQLDRRQMPGADLLDGLWILVAGVLLLTPGFITDALGLVLLVPPARTTASRLVGMAALRRITSFMPGA